MEDIRFKSVKAPDKIMYVWMKSQHDGPNSAFYGNCRNYVANTAYQFDTYGDGNTQHSPMYLVPSENIEDYIISLSLYISDNPTKETFELFNYSHHISFTNRSTIEFLRSLPAKNGKAVYYNLAELKKSKSESKQHDKRWEKVPDAYEASFEDIFNILCPSFFGLLDRLFLAEQIREFTDYNIWVDFNEFFNIDRQSHMFTGLNIIQAFIKGMTKIDYVERGASCLRHNIGLETTD